MAGSSEEEYIPSSEDESPVIYRHRRRHKKQIDDSENDISSSNHSRKRPSRKQEKKEVINLALSDSDESDSVGVASLQNLSVNHNATNQRKRFSLSQHHTKSSLRFQHNEEDNNSEDDDNLSSILQPVRLQFGAFSRF